MKSRNISTDLNVLGMIGLAWAAYQYAANPRIDAAIFLFRGRRLDNPTGLGTIGQEGRVERSKPCGS